MRERLQSERKAHFLETINTFGSLLMKTSTTQESVWCVTKHAVGELGYIDCIIYLFNDDGVLFQCAAHGNKNPIAQDVLNPIKLKMGEGICGHVALTGIGEIIADTSKDPRYIVDDEDRRSEITVPILSDGIVIGIIDSEYPEKDYFSDHDLKILNTIASMLSFKISQSKAVEELAITNKQLAFQHEEKQKQADELAIANKELAFQNDEKEKRADELAIANKELAFQNDEKEKRADELAIANKELTFQNGEKQKRANELAIANKELTFQNDEKQKRANELAIAKKELDFQVVLTKNRIETESIAKELRQFIETANAPIFGIDNKGMVNEWNQTSEKITGFKKEDVLGQNLVKTYITEDYRDAVKKVLDNALKGQETANYEFPLFTKGGQRVMVLLNASTRRNAEGEIVGVLGVGQDISEMDKLRTQSESVAKELRQFIETANAPIFGIDNKGRVNEWNQTSEKITRFKKEDVLGEDLVQTYITQDYQKQVKEVLDNALKGQETANYEFPLFTKGGQRVMVLLNASTRRNAEGEIVGVIGVGQDITILNEHKENLESKVESRTQEFQESLEREKELGQLKTSFVSMASHEFRTPLTSINAIADVILRYYEKLSRNDINKRLEKIKEEVEDMVIMLEDILIIGKSEAQKLDYNPKLLDIVALIKNIITEYQFGESEKRFIVYDISLPVIMAQVDKKWIKHIIINLFSNALKYSNKDKQIEISIKKEQSGISFSFEDYGIGISKQDIKLLFKPFHRGNNVQNISGTGLGLSVLQKAVELHKGTIEVKSKIGKGSYFRIILPINK
ncbi:two-component histidine kinase sensor with PAS and GAF domains [Psychroflexus torquis ATCC 700755]|uniref:histidine kinase n=1 Tax=Psychroflexus torquis (strain ATCC 700755 / CIP 106069 / ACAM 623) TaxID=313595 RepID=K4INI5_PSYTT|nr:PAS domain-containing protein [Psychroflexus torquis]AFU70581.1 two-component histidine kinase sensor with PAS and GAF domains [Psychroflexus torquis ATCC 700755]